MPIKVNCPSCGATLNAKDSLAGKRVKCPHCSKPVKIPDDSGDTVQDAEEFGDFDFGGYDPNEGEALERRKPCPMCGEMIVEGAAKCRYCGEIFDPLLKKRAKKKSRASSSDSRGGDDEDLEVVDWVLAILCSGIGCILGIVYMIQGKPKGLKMIGLSLLFGFLWGIIRAVIESAGQR